jgi:mannitol-1-/sugar-/sorbitol-6-phosphatase
MVEVACSGLLFDLDGVLVDSTPAVSRVWSVWALEHGFDPEHTVRIAHGRPSRSTIRDLLPNSDYEAENRKVEQGEINDTQGVVPMPGARELLNSLPIDRWAIVTSCTRALAEVRLKAAGLQIPARLLTSDDVVNGKPDPEPYRKGAALLGVSADKCLVFEDTPAGIRAGKAADALVVAFTTTATTPELEEAGADWIVKGCESVSVLNSDHGVESVRLRLEE